MYVFNCRQIKAVVRSCVKNIHQPMVDENEDTAVTKLTLLHPPGEVTDTPQYRHTERHMYTYRETYVDIQRDICIHTERHM